MIAAAGESTHVLHNLLLLEGCLLPCRRTGRGRRVVNVHQLREHIDVDLVLHLLLLLLLLRLVSVVESRGG